MAGLITVYVLMAVGIYLCWLMLQPFFTVLLWAVVLRVVAHPMHRVIRARLGRPGLAAIVSTTLVVLLVLVPLTAITVTVVRELSGAAALVNSGHGFTLGDWPAAGWVLDLLRDRFGVDAAAAREFIASRLATWGAALAGSTLLVVGGAVGAVVQTGLVVFVLFYLFRDGERIQRAGSDLLPLNRRQMHDILGRTRDVIEATIYGVLVISAIQGTLGTVIFWMLGLPSPLLWGVVMFFLSMIPMAGAFIVWAPAALYLAATGAYIQAVILVAWGVLVIGSIDNFLSPRLVGRRTSLHELLIFFGVLGGLQVFGVLGVILGPVVVALTLALVEMARQSSPGHTPGDSTGDGPALDLDLLQLRSER